MFTRYSRDRKTHASKKIIKKIVKKNKSHLWYYALKTKVILLHY